MKITAHEAKAGRELWMHTGPSHHVRAMYRHRDGRWEKRGGLGEAWKRVAIEAVHPEIRTRHLEEEARARDAR